MGAERRWFFCLRTRQAPSILHQAVSYTHLTLPTTPYV